MAKNGKLNLNVFSAREMEATPWKITDVIFTYFFVFALSLIAVGILLISKIDTDTSFFPAILQIIISVATIGIIYIIVTKKYKLSFFESFGISFKDTPTYITKGIFVFLALIASTTIISLAFSQLIGVQKQDPYSNMSVEKLKMISILAIFIAPIVEEIFFRGFMQPALTKHLGAFGGIFITALIFGLSHAQYLEYSAALVAVTGIGIILGIARYHTGSVMPGMIAHLLNNLFAAISLFK